MFYLRIYEYSGIGGTPLGIICYLINLKNHNLSTRITADLLLTSDKLVGRCVQLISEGNELID